MAVLDLRVIAVQHRALCILCALCTNHCLCDAGRAGSGSSHHHHTQSATTISTTTSSVISIKGGNSAGQEVLRRRLQVLRVRALAALRIFKPAAREFKIVLQEAACAGQELVRFQFDSNSNITFTLCLPSINLTLRPQRTPTVVHSQQSPVEK